MARDKGKNYLPALLLSIFWWILLGLLIVLVDPEVLADFPFASTYGVFSLILFLAVWFSASLILANRRRGALVAIMVVILCYLRIWKIWSLLSTVLLLVALLAFEVSFSGGLSRSKRTEDEFDTT